MSTPKERPILMCAEMVRATLDGRKTQTRRVVNPQPKLCEPHSMDHWLWKGAVAPFEKGMHLWVRETWRTIYDPATCLEGHLDIDYKADGTERIGDKIGTLKWRPSIFMPRWASRITLEITDVRVERVQDITASDALAEGIVRDDRQLRETPNFRQLWDSLNLKRGFGWFVNPFVWVVSFRRLL